MADVVEILDTVQPALAVDWYGCGPEVSGRNRISQHLVSNCHISYRNNQHLTTTPATSHQTGHTTQKYFTGSCLSQDYSRDSLMRKYFSETSSYKSDEKVVSSGCLWSAQYHLNQSVRIKEIILNRVKLLLNMSQLEQQWAVYQDVIRLNLIDKW